MPQEEKKTKKKGMTSAAEKTTPKATPKPSDIPKKPLKPMSREQLEALRRRLQKKFH